MRIVQIDKLPKWCGQTQQTFYLAAGLKRRGHEVLVVGEPGSALVERARAERLPVLCLSMKGWRLFPSAPRLAPALRKGRFEIVHAHGARDHLLAAMAAAFSPSAAVVRSKHNLTAIKGPVLYRHFAARLIAVSHAAKEVLLACGVSAEKVSVVYDGVDLERFAPREKDPSPLEEFGIGPGAFIIGTTGRLASKSKGIPTLLRAAQIVCGRAPHTRFLLIGRKDPQIQGLADSLGLRDHAFFTGFREDIPRLLALLDLYVQPSVRDAFPSSVLEAMAMAKPVLATRVGGIPEAVAEGETAVLCEPGNVEEMAHAMLGLMNDRDALKRMGLAGRARVERRFSLERMIDGIEEVYRSVLRTC